MADLDVWKKYPVEGEEGEDSYRLDHPTFQNVQRTAYAKGVITDFKKLSEDPLEVDSMVKVDVEGYGETSDYIPLFYHPKEQYWDDEENDILATDFDEAQKCFKQAWMSFRGDDEVVVLMQADEQGDSLTPKYVLGFIDNYPRIGENIFKFESEFLTDYYKVSPIDTYEDDNLGPDGNELGLLTESEVILHESEMFYDYGRCYTDGSWNKCATVYITEHLFTIGPFLILVQAHYYYLPPKEFFPPPVYIYLPPTWGTPTVRCQIGLYSTELYNSILSGPTLHRTPALNAYTPAETSLGGIAWLRDWWNEYDGLVHAPGMFISGVSSSTTVSQDWSDVRFYVRPHTKEELIAAGFMNEDGTLPDE